MLRDPLIIRIIPAQSTLANLALADFTSASTLSIRNIDGGNTTRQSLPDSDGVRAQLSVSSIETKENKAVVTDRRAIRFELRGFDADLNQEIVASATLVCSIPRAGLFAPSGSRHLEPVNRLLSILTIGDWPADEATKATSNVSPTLARMLDGEG